MSVLLPIIFLDFGRENFLGLGEKHPCAQGFHCNHFLDMNVKWGCIGFPENVGWNGWKELLVLEHNDIWLCQQGSLKSKFVWWNTRKNNFSWIATILWCLNHDWPKDLKIQYRNLVLLLSTSPNLHTGRDIQSRHIFDKMMDRDVVSWTILIDELVMGHDLCSMH